MSHALLNASGASRWLNCPPSARLEEQFPDSTSEAAAEGTLAHALGELKLQKYFTPMAKSTFTKAHNKIKKDPLYTKEMEDYTDEYLDYIKSVTLGFPSAPYATIEKKVDFSMYAPEGFGTADCIVIGGGTLYIIDLKYGKGVPVSAEKNAQMRLYALGALNEYSLIYNIEMINMVIFQPRLDNISVDQIESAVLLNWGNAFVKPLADLAYKGEGDFTPGDHCRFCRAKAVCRARSVTNTALEDFKGKLPPLISNEEVGDLLLKAQDLAKWAKDLEEYALSACLAGENIPGWKAVEGRSNRAFTDIDAAFKAIKEKGLAKEEVLYIRKPITLTETEKLIGKKEFETALSEFIIKPPGKPALAKATDKREPITLKDSAQSDFANIQL
ncbi:Uncharacterised protein [Acetobacterium wieringae]|uniref:DUF2800 domain-containing protein n=1 Tax=Acetobacterium wieringae TaxID=52694 RepID=UPI001DA635BF|nr:DUF2800 domain-containing protein [Acetobacterium wieringae]VUZ28505.1 Uncharacterised protein [Acetobacterium wieringae]